MKTSVPPQPMQPIVVDDKGVARFRKNKLVCRLLDAANRGEKLDLNRLAQMDAPDDDFEQFWQLMGYSVGGYSELDFVSDKTYKRAEGLAKHALEAYEKTKSK